MIIRLDRLIATTTSTIGQLSVGELVLTTLEDPIRKVKIHGDTCIPPGQYEIKLRTDGAKSPAYAKKFPDMHHGMLWLQDVPGFEYVYIHIGNYPRDTEGCVLVGTGQQKDMVTGSTDAYKELYPRVAKAIMSGDDVLLDISNPRGM